jgi:hypothetical protein
LFFDIGFIFFDDDIDVNEPTPPGRRRGKEKREKGMYGNEKERGREIEKETWEKGGCKRRKEKERERRRRYGNEKGDRREKRKRKKQEEGEAW